MPPPANVPQEVPCCIKDLDQPILTHPEIALVVHNHVIDLTVVKQEAWTVLIPEDIY